jgi:hypothetical protein
LQGFTEAAYGRLKKVRDLLRRASEFGKQDGAMDRAAVLLADAGHSSRVIAAASPNACRRSRADEGRPGHHRISEELPAITHILNLRQKLGIESASPEHSLTVHNRLQVCTLAVD